MRGEWCYFSKYFNPDYCQGIIDKVGNNYWQSAKIGVSNQTLDETLRRSDTTFITADDERFQDLFRELWHLASWANRDWFDLHISKLDYVQIARYDADTQGEYKKHHDVFWMNSDPKYHRKLTLLIQLTDPNDYSGGEFELSDVNEIPPAHELKQQGTVIIFPSLFPHQAHPVTWGTRYSLAAWFDGPKWR
jgi:PKHD-type hydroxylase